MPTTRRKFLTLIGGGVVVAAAVPSAAFLATRTPTKALAPWDMAGQYPDPRLRALSFALLAPNPHNRQPWEAELVGADAVTIWRDPARDLPATDPYARQLTIGMGCFLELMDIAAAEEGFAVETTLFPDGEDGPVAQCRFVPKAASPDPLFAHVLNRRSHKELFSDRPVDAVPLLELLGEVVTAPAQLARLKTLAKDAWMVEVTTPATWQESVDLLRIGKGQINANPDGIDVGGPMMDALKLAGLLTREAAGDIDNPGTRQSIDAMLAAVDSAPAMILQKTAGNTRADQIAAGRRWVRLNLTTTAGGMALRPVSQVLQEYPEMAPLYQAIHAEFAGPGETVQMLGLLGYADRTPRTPRWPLETRLRNA
ncbi:MAG: twin-arginine translocation pathway signal protein [Dinoroseobacter sp.]|nr:twin-arginine translocation pathway signal protein [Dinoroseobacter sp.]